jgi:molybdopterin molybdotransferase
MEFLKSITRKAALEIINAFPLNPKVETIDIEDALDRVLAENIISGEDIPPFSRSLVDGFAVKVKDTYGAKETSPLFLTVSGRVEIGQKTDIILDDGHCAGISTGAMIPEGTDGIVMEEYVRRMPDAVEVTKTVHKGENICFQGEDITKGDVVLKKGKILSPFDIGILSALGIIKPLVFKKPEIALISSGDEITSIDETPPLGKIRDINRYTVSNILRKEGVNITFVGIARDSINEITEKLISAQNYDAILISGGSSKGERDYITDAIEKLGGRILFHGVNIKPGKPTIFGKLWDKPIFGLPGHPNSCIMAVIRFVFPLLQRFKGESIQDRKWTKAVLTTNIPSSYGIEEYVRVSIEAIDGTYRATPIFAKSSIISSLASASGYITVPESTEGYEKDEEVEVYFY